MKFFLAKIQANNIPGIKMINVETIPILILKNKALISKSVNYFPF